MRRWPSNCPRPWSISEPPVAYLVVTDGYDQARVEAIYYAIFLREWSAGAGEIYFARVREMYEGLDGTGGAGYS